MKNAPVSVLLVDDDPDYLFQLTLYLEKAGYDVVSAESQGEAEMILSKMKPDIAILDLMMEKEDSGFILCYKIKKRYPDVPIIILTGVTVETGITFDITDENNRKWIKADLFLEKGIRHDILKQKIKLLLTKNT